MSDSDIRTFGEFEKKIINEIKNLDDEGSYVTPLNILSGLKEFKKLAFVDSDGFSVTYCDKLNLASDKDKKIVKETERNLCDFVLLMEYLIKEEYLFEIKGNTSAEENQNNEIVSKLKEKTPQPGYEQNIPIDDKITEKLTKIWKSYFRCTNKLYELVEHEFLERSLYEERKNNCLTRAIGIVAIVVPLITPVVTSKCTNEPAQKIDIQKISDSAVLSVKQAENENPSAEEPVLTVTNQPASENSTEPDKTEATETVDKIETNTQAQGESK